MKTTPFASRHNRGTPAENFTLVVSGVNNTAGDALAEIYEAP